MPIIFLKCSNIRFIPQDIRVLSLSLDYIRSSSGHNREAWPIELTRNNACADSTQETDPESAEKEPLFMYGERIVSRKKRRSHRPMSAVEHQAQHSDTESLQTSEHLPRHTRLTTRSARMRPKSAGVTWQTTSASSYDGDSDAVSVTSAGGQGSMLNVPVNTPTSGRDTPMTCDTPTRDHTPYSELRDAITTPTVRNETPTPLPLFEAAITESGRVCNSPGWPINVSIHRATPRQSWEDETHEVTKKILAAQERAGRRRDNLYLDRGEVLTSDFSRNFRGLERKDRIQFVTRTASSRSSSDFGELMSRRAGVTGNGGHRRSTFRESTSQKVVSLSEGPFKNLGIQDSKRQTKQVTGGVHRVKSFNRDSSSRQMLISAV